MFINKIFHRLFSDIYANRIALGCILIYITVSQYFFDSVCPTAILFGFPCPACGLTRAGIFFLLGRLSDAWHMNPCIFIVIPYLLYLAFFRYVRDKKAPFITAVTIIAGILVLLIYLIRLITGTLPPILTPGIFSKLFF